MGDAFHSFSQFGFRGHLSAAQRYLLADKPTQAEHHVDEAAKIDPFNPEISFIRAQLNPLLRVSGLTSTTSPPSSSLAAPNPVPASPENAERMWMTPIYTGGWAGEETDDPKLPCKVTAHVGDIAIEIHVGFANDQQGKTIQSFGVRFYALSEPPTLRPGVEMKILNDSRACFRDATARRAHGANTGVDNMIQLVFVSQLNEDFAVVLIEPESGVGRENTPRRETWFTSEQIREALKEHFPNFSPNPQLAG